MNNNQLAYFIALQMVPNVGPSISKNLIAYCGGPENVFIEKKNHLLKIPGVGPVIASSIISFKDFERADKEMEFIAKNRIKALSYLDPAYPQRLRDVDDAPIVLFTKGNADFNTAKVIGIVGTRRATDYGKEVCARLVGEMKDYNVTIVSGLAYGIDYQAHRNALNNDLPTIAVLGHGLDKLYPAEHNAIAKEMMNKGALVSEYISETIPDKTNFPERNRIVAGMVDALIVVESGIRGGALITAEIAWSYNRELFAVPGNLDAEVSAGCNRLIKLNKANVIESVNDIAYHLAWDIKKPDKAKPKMDMKGLSPNEKAIVDILSSNGKIHIDKLAATLQKPTSDLSVSLIEMEFMGLIKALPGSFYKLV